MSKKIWIINHYATETYYSEGGRHYWFAQNLINEGYEPTIFCANTRHNTTDVMNIDSGVYTLKERNNIPFVFVKSTEYQGNGKARVYNMLSFYRNFLRGAKQHIKEFGKPEAILASSVHPLTLVAGIKLGKKFGVPCICEVRDLWPESIVVYGSLKRDSMIAKLLYQGEKWIYKKADKLIFTCEGGKDYIIEQGWNKELGGPIDLNKVFYINNGVDIEAFNMNKVQDQLDDNDLISDKFKIIYTGSIRKANNVQVIVDAAEMMQNLQMDDIIFIIYGDGDQKDYLEKYCKEKNIRNINFKGRVDKKYIPYILSNSDLNIMDLFHDELFRFGLSPNKLFGYFASGKPIVSLETNYDMIKRYECGIVLKDLELNSICDAIRQIYSMDKEEYKRMCVNSELAARDFDFKILTTRLIDIIEDK